jgi:DNA replication and repair protein RecF
MRLIDLELNNFRNMEDTRLEFSPAVNLITGRNSQGKTNLLEAIYLFSLGRSFRTMNRTEMIRFREKHFYLKITAESDTGIRNVFEIGIARSGESRIRIDGERVSGFSRVIGRVPGVLFTADDVELVSGSPGQRRSFIDYTASQISEEYLETLRDYHRALRQRNAQLKSNEAEAGREMARTLGTVLAEKGERVVAGRRELLADIEESSKELLEEIFPGGLGLRMEYVSSVAEAEGSYSDRLGGILERRMEEDIRRGYTSAGPHRDDIRITADQLEMRKFGSQGRKRLVAIVMKIAQAGIINRRKGEKPVVLLDDIFSELDRGVESRVEGFISRQYQNFITSPRPVQLTAGDEIRSFSIEGGVIT